MKEGQLQQAIQKVYLAKPALLDSLAMCTFEEQESSYSLPEEIAKDFPFGQKSSKVLVKRGKKPTEKKKLRVGVLFSGGQAPGGHNVILGLWESLKQLSPQSELIGFLGGPDGLLHNHQAPLEEEVLQAYRNQGGFDLLGSGRTKIETKEQLEQAKQTALALQLDGLVIIGGDDSNTNAALLAESFKKEQVPTTVVGVPKTIDGDLKNEEIPISFGFDTACGVYAELIGNIERDCLSAKKYYHFVRLMGRSASNITLECALRTHPNLALIGEEVQAKQLSLRQVVEQVADLVEERAKIGKNYGVVLLPEGLIEFIPEVQRLIAELNHLLSDATDPQQAVEKLSAESRACFRVMPWALQQQLLLDRDPHGNVRVSQIETERLFIEMTQAELEKRKAEGSYSGKFQAIPHFFGYEGRCAYPSAFDAIYCYALGSTSALLVKGKYSGYMSQLTGVEGEVQDWQPGGVPIAQLLHLEKRKGKLKPVIRKALVDLHSRPFHYFSQAREQWREQDHYKYPGPMQYFGEEAVCNVRPLTLQLEQSSTTEAIDKDLRTRNLSSVHSSVHSFDH